MKRRSYVMVISGPYKGRIAQVIDYDHDVTTYALFVNYNGFFILVRTNQIRQATTEERKKDKKRHRREHQLDRDQRRYFNDARYRNSQSILH